MSLTTSTKNKPEDNGSSKDKEQNPLRKEEGFKMKPLSLPPNTTYTPTQTSHTCMHAQSRMHKTPEKTLRAVVF